VTKQSEPKTKIKKKTPQKQPFLAGGCFILEKRSTFTGAPLF
jgi:hypothetical protein